MNAELRIGTNQRGIVLILLAVMLILLASGYYFSTISLAENRAEQQRQTRQVLLQAKQALLSYAATYHDLKAQGDFGFLPCPDYNNGLAEGVEDSGNCGSKGVSKIGFLPWRSLETGPLKDASGNCLLYAVSGAYKNDESAVSKKADMLNADSYGAFQISDNSGALISGIDADERIVAVVIAPGASLSYQNRNLDPNRVCGGEYGNLSAYLDNAAGVDNAGVSNTAWDVDVFIGSWPGGELVVNDHMITISRDELWQVIGQRKEFDTSLTTGESLARRVTEALAQCLALYVNDAGKQHLPYATLVDLAGADYRLNSSYDDAMGAYLGRYPYRVGTSNTLINGVAGTVELFNINFTTAPACDALPIAFPPAANADLRDADSPERRFWENWKDHFFYVVSREYRPRPTAMPAAPRCGNCISVGGNAYAAAVIFSGSPLAGQQRDYPVAPGDSLNNKGNSANYLEVANLQTDGTGDFTPTNNDFMFCLTDSDPVQVQACP